MGYHYGTLRASPTELWFATSTGLVMYDVQQKKIRRQVATSRGQVFLTDYSLAVNDRILTIYDPEGTTAIRSFDLTTYIDTKKGIGHAIWGAYQDAQKTIWLVVKDSNWDGVLLRFDAKGLQKMDLIPHDYFDSGRSVRIQAVDKKGNLWVQVDSENYIYTPDGKWVIPNLPTQAGTRSAQVLLNASGNLLAADGKKLYAVHL
jgi:ligand-binding sensor domain-containing protein